MVLGALWTLLRRLVFYCRLYAGSLLYPPIRTHPFNNVSVQRLDRWTIAKRSKRAKHEAESTRFVAANTTLPVPRVYDLWVDNSDSTDGWIVMDFIAGKLLRQCWPYMDTMQRSRVQAQITRFLGSLRSIPDPRGGQICSCVGGPVFDARIAMGKFVGPFASITEFHDFLYERATRDIPPDISFRPPRHHDRYRVVFTHADFHPEQILLDVNDYARVVGILDWEMAGWYPEYWEYTKGMQGAKLDGSSWRDVLTQAMGSYYDEEQKEWDLMDFQGHVS